MGPAVAMLDVRDLWIYWLAPIAGMALAAVCYRALREDQTEPGHEIRGKDQRGS